MKKYIITISLFSIFFIFNIYVFFPVLNQSKDLPWSILIQDRNWEILTNKWFKDGYYKEYKWEINTKNDFIKSLINQEDKRFFKHFWIDILSKFRAFYTNIKIWKIVSGWSTLTEQFIKNKYFNKQKRTYLQKVREAYLSIFFSIFYNKNYILKEYLENIYFWNNIYWISWAIETYFKKQDLSELNQEEIKKLLEIIKNPSLANKLPKAKNIDEYPFITNEVLKEFEWKKVREIVYKTTISKKLQDFSFDLLNKTIKELASKNVTNWSLIAFNPNNWEIIAYHWSRDFYNKEIDWQVDVIKQKRQLWSTFKPFLYLQALEKWAEIDDLIIDVENKYNVENSKEVYYTQNYSLKEYWLVRLKKALWNSLNNASVRLWFELWLENVYNFYKKYWFKLDNPSNFYWLWLVLWNASITLEDLAISYSHLLPEFDIDNNFKLTFDINKNYKRAKKDIDKNKFLLYEILSNPDNRDVSFWVNSILNTPIKMAVKTWTSSNFRDNALIWYNSDLVIWIWVWNNDNSSMMWVSWITWAWYIFNQFVKEAFSEWFIKEKNYELPKWVSQYDYFLDFLEYRKELSYKKKKNHKSRLLENYFSKDDVFEKLDDYEIKKLDDMWMILK